MLGMLSKLVVLSASHARRLSMLVVSSASHARRAEHAFGVVSQSC